MIPSKHRHRIRVVAAICLVGAVSLLLWMRHGAGSTASVRTDRERTKTRLIASSTAVSPPVDPLAPSQANASEAQPGHPAQPNTITPAPDYESEDFTHVPDWMPRPADAVSARAENASLRSDGFLEGTLRFTFRKDQTGVLQEIISHLKAAGMHANTDGFLYASENPPRRCEVRVEPSPDGVMMVSLSYQGTDHEKGCHCPTCGGPPENP